MLYERGVDNQGFGRILSKGDSALFGGRTTQDMKSQLAVPDGRPLADFLPTITIKAKDFANEVTNLQVKQQDMRDESGITLEAAEDVKKVEHRLKSEEKKLPKLVPSPRGPKRKR